MAIEPDNPLTSKEFYSKNDDLAGRFKAASQSAKRNILEELYKLDIKLFQGWRVQGDAREDYQQEACLWLSRALQTYQPKRGPFVNHLRGYILNTFRHHVKVTRRGGVKGQVSTDELPEVSDTQDETGHDPLFWRKVKSKVTPDQWDLIRLRYHHGKTIDEIAKLKGTYADRIRKPLMEALNAVKLITVTNPGESQTKIPAPAQVDSQWIQPQHLSRILGIEEKAIREFINPDLHPNKCPTIIDPRDVLRLSRKRVRIRYQETDKGITYPRFLKRGQSTGQAGYL